MNRALIKKIGKKKNLEVMILNEEEKPCMDDCYAKCKYYRKKAEEDGMKNNIVAFNQPIEKQEEKEEEESNSSEEVIEINEEETKEIEESNLNNIEIKQNEDDEQKEDILHTPDRQDVPKDFNPKFDIIRLDCLYDVPEFINTAITIPGEWKSVIGDELN
eukprot:CAMPEP_0117429828 /NCGR_PEP_ID=MMETSP0758-20121206/9360_1 /TAXON_ID=63605 /ORGANISM="Percolomonas cosmopolitus, Strain AE-1 (ATCC 50343)" /LENGTH=159 /DNA_ID=CAMNT_0005217223 /DNA_START=169 /DNA_END=648 /DNA_ORIENTATION=+